MKAISLIAGCLMIASCSQEISPTPAQPVAKIKTETVFSMRDNRLWTGPSIDAPEKDISPEHWEKEISNTAHPLTKKICQNTDHPELEYRIIKREIIDQNPKILLIKTRYKGCEPIGPGGSTERVSYSYMTKQSSPGQEHPISGYVQKGFALGEWENAKESQVSLSGSHLIIEAPFREADTCGPFPHFSGPDKTWRHRGYTCYLTEKSYKKIHSPIPRIPQGIEIISYPAWPKPGMLRVRLDIACDATSCTYQ